MTEVAVDKLERMLSSRMSPDDLAQMARLVPLPVRQELARLLHTTAPLQSAMLFRVPEKNDALAVPENLPPDYQAELLRALRQPEVAEIIEDSTPATVQSCLGSSPPASSVN